jgi:hypothetical protein
MQKIQNLYPASGKYRHSGGLVSKIEQVIQKKETGD